MYNQLTPFLSRRGAAALQVEDCLIMAQLPSQLTKAFIQVSSTVSDY